MQSDSIAKFADLSGKTFGRLTVQGLNRIQRQGREDRRFWDCTCVCGMKHVRREDYLKKSGANACRACEAIKNGLEPPLVPETTTYEYLQKTIKALNYDPQLPWSTYACLDWPYGTSADGYGLTLKDGKQIRASRATFELVHGVTLTREQGVYHHCDRGVCHHPSHLFSGVQADNIDDCVSKNRHCHGEKHGMHEITDDIAKEVLRLYATGKYKQTEIGRMTGVGKHSVWRIVHHKQWKHVSL